MSSWDENPKTSDAPRPWKRASRVPMVLVSLGVGAFFLFARSNHRTWREGRESGQWPGVPGLVDSFAIAPNSLGRPEATLAYHYEVDGVRYDGNRLHAVGHELREPEAAWLGERLQAGSRVVVRHDPSDPSRSALAVGSGMDELEGMEAGWFSLLFVSVFGFGLYGSKRRGTVLAIGDGLARRVRSKAGAA